MSPILGVWASAQQSAFVVTNSYQSISTVTVGSGGASNITFSSIPSTYTHLQLRYIARGTSASNPTMTFNSDTTGTNYSWHVVYGTGAAAAAANTANTNNILLNNIDTVANSFTVGVIDILDYANTNKYKTTREFSGQDYNGSGNIVLFSGLWRNTTAISNINLAFGSYTQYTQFALYGIKGA